MRRELIDITIDTNVLIHAQNPQEDCFEASNYLLEELLKTKTKICIDEGFDPNTGQNKSIIGFEYISHIRPGSKSYSFLFKLFQNKRISELQKFPELSKKKIIKRLIPKEEQTDRIFLGVACNSQECILTTHDKPHFLSKRFPIRNKLKVVVHCAQEICNSDISCNCGCSRIN